MSTEQKIFRKKTVCPLDCPDSCGMIATVQNGRVTSLVGDPEHPYTNGFICRKMRKYPARVHGPQRLLYPQKRVGKKGEGRFERIGWDEALTLLSEKINQVVAEYGGEAILPYQYAGNMGIINRNAGYPLYHHLGTSRIEETICSAAAGAGWTAHLPDIPGSPPELAANSELIVAWGINIKVSNVHFWRYVAQARKKGGKLLVIDPYRNETARSADIHLRVGVGGDGPLALGMLKYLIEESLLNRDQLISTTDGFTELEEYLRNTPWPEFVRLSGVEYEDIAQCAQLLKDNPGTFLRIGIGLSRNSRGGMSVRSIVSLAAALGLFEGGEDRGVLLSSKGFSGQNDLLRFPELMSAPSRVVNMAHLGHALTSLQPPVKLFLVYNCNPLSVAPDTSMVRKGLERDDLFTVVHEQVLTPTARYADLLLPATTFLENRDAYTGYGHFQFGVVDRVIEPVGEAKSNFTFFQELSAYLGLKQYPFDQTLEQRLEAYLNTVDGLPESFSYGQAADGKWFTSTRRRVHRSISTRWGKRFHFSGTQNAEPSDYPRLLEPEEFGDKSLQSRYPLQLIIPPHRDLLNSTFGESWLHTVGKVLIHPEDASRFNILDGQMSRLYNGRGFADRIAVVTTDTSPGLLVAEGIYWQNEQSMSGINDLTSQKLTDAAGGPTFHESLVTIGHVPGRAEGDE